MLGDGIDAERRVSEDGDCKRRFELGRQVGHGGLSQDQDVEVARQAYCRLYDTAVMSLLVTVAAHGIGLAFDERGHSDLLSGFRCLLFDHRLDAVDGRFAGAD